LRKRLRELVFARGLTELELSKKIGIDINSWDQISRGVRRPSHTLVNELMKILGDEVQLLFIGYYITPHFPKLVSADIYEKDSITKMLQEDIKEVKKRSKKFVYLNY